MCVIFVKVGVPVGYEDLCGRLGIDGTPVGSWECLRVVRVGNPVG